MPLSWNEIRSRAHAFSHKWVGEESERAEAQSFWNDFFGVFGIERRRVAIFEKQVQIARAGEKLKHGRIDAFWKGMLLIEHKSRGADLNRAFAQAADYFDGLAERDLPRYILVSDFERFRLYDLEENTETEFKLADLHKRIKHFAFIAGYRTQLIQPQNPVNIKAAERMGRLHDRLKASGYEGHPLEVLLVRLLFCLFAEDTGIFQTGSFRALLDERTAADGSDLGPQLAQFFQVLNTPEDKRSKNLDEQLAAFLYVNGRLFEETLPIAAFDAAMREALLDCTALDWSAISPAIFGALFQSIMDDKARRNLGAHYTSEENILKLIKPLFLDGLWAEFEKIKKTKNKLFEFHKKLRSLTFFDPACGCGNFLVIAYRELRTLELDVLRAVHQDQGSRFLDIHQEIQIDVDQFYGIEIEEFPAQIAQVALWLMDHQMNVRVSEEFGLYFARIPLKTSPHIVNNNALTLDWNDVLPAERASYVFGNPPFAGKHYQSKAQKAELVKVFEGMKAASDLDYVTAWYLKAAKFISGTTVRCAFVSTNSITQGEQVPLLWPLLLGRYSMKIHFAHRTFQWSNEARGMAAVHCVIIGFGAFDVDRKTIFEYDDPKSEPHAVVDGNISPYITFAPDVVIEKRQRPLGQVPTMTCGSKPSDGGHLVLKQAEYDDLVSAEPSAKRFLQPYVGSEEFINGGHRWCLWLVNAKPEELRRLPLVMERVEGVKTFRHASSAEPTRRAAATPTRFFFQAQPESEFIVIPEVSSERRMYVPLGLLTPNVIVSNKLYLVESNSRYLFGVLQSTMHMAWIRAVAGRLESRYQYSGTMVYNTFPWPDQPTDTQRDKIKVAAQVLLDTRAQFPNATLADLYDPLTMPPTLLKAHQKLDAAVDKAYGKTSFKNDAERVAFLFERYQALTSLLPKEEYKKRARTKERD